MTWLWFGPRGRRWAEVGGGGKAKERVWPLTRWETTAFCDTWTQRLFFFPFQFQVRNFFGNFSNLLSKQESDGELDWAPGPQAVAPSGHGEEGLTAMVHQRRGCLCLKPITKMLPAHSLPPLCLRNAWKSLQKTKAWRTKACPPRLPGKRVPVSLHPRFSWAQVQLWPGLPQHILGPPMSSHQRDPPQKAAGSGWSRGWATDSTSQSVTETRSLCGPLWARLPWAPHVLGLDPMQKATLLFRRSPTTWRRHQVIFLSHPAIHPLPT